MNYQGIVRQKILKCHYTNAARERSLPIKGSNVVEGFVLGPYRTFQIAITGLRSPAATTSVR
jgi:hypothetical protein